MGGKYCILLGLLQFFSYPVCRHCGCMWSSLTEYLMHFVVSSGTAFVQFTSRESADQCLAKAESGERVSGC